MNARIFPAKLKLAAQTRSHSGSTLATFAAALLCAALMQLTVVSTAAAATPKKPNAIPRLSDGRPNLQGLWIVNMPVPQVEGSDKVSTAGPPPRRGELPPYQPWAAERMKQLAADINHNDPQIRCLPPGVPRVQTWPWPFEIVQTPTRVVILYEAMRVYRIIPLDESDFPKDIDPQYMGTSIGHWQGDTLVVRSTGFNDRTWLSAPGSFHSDALQVVERFTLGPDKIMHYEAMTEDPKVFTAPWKAVAQDYRLFPRKERIREYECNDDNRDYDILGLGDNKSAAPTK